jgi:hypothetical protein
MPVYVHRMSKLEKLDPTATQSLNLAFQNAVQGVTNTFQERDKLLGQAMIQVALVLGRENEVFNRDAVLRMSKEAYGYLGEDIARHLNGIATTVLEYRNVAPPSL